MGKIYTYTILFIGILLQSYCSTSEFILPPLKPAVRKVKFKNKNQYNGHQLRLSIPENWNYIIEKKSKAVITFESPDHNIKGQVFVYKTKQTDFEKLFNDYLSLKTEVRFLWRKRVRILNGEGFMAKGLLVKSEDILGEKKDYYTGYLALYSSNNIIYEVVLLGKGKNVHFDDEAFKIITGFRGGIRSNTVEYRRFSIRIKELKEWIPQSTQNKQIINWVHKSKAIQLNISHLEKRKKKPKDFKSGIKKYIDQYRILLVKANYKYDFDIRGSRITKKKRKAVVFHAVGTKEGKKLGVIKYYFWIRNNLYSAEILFTNADWKKRVRSEVEKVFNAIFLTK